jgi:hypothetical protein
LTNIGTFLNISTTTGLGIEVPEGVNTVIPLAADTAER